MNEQEIQRLRDALEESRELLREWQGRAFGRGSNDA